jgi:multidrug efflux system outer membrane protein
MFRRAARVALACLFAQGLLACAPAPVLPPPAARVPESFREPAAQGEAGASLATASAAETPMPPDGWWQVFGDDRLDALIRRARQGNPGLQQAGARVAKAAATLGLSAAQRRPQLGVGVFATRQVGPLVNAAGDQGNLFSADLRLSLDADLLHKLSRQQQSAWHDLQAQQALGRQAQVLLEASVADSYLAWRGLRLEQRALSAVLQADRALLAVAERRVRAGLAAAPVRSAALAELGADEAEAQDLARRMALLEHALAALVGDFEDLGLDDHPGGLAREADASAAAIDVTAPAPVPIASAAEPMATADALAQAAPGDTAWSPLPAIPPGLPSRMLQRRPDVAAASQALQAARLRLGVARDAWFPDLVLTANAGFASSELSRWLRLSARNAGLGLLLSLPGLDGGRADAQRAAAAADVELATAEHREKVLLALREVDDQLATLRTLAAEAATRRDGAEDAAREAARLGGQWQRGLIGEGDVLQAQRLAQRQQRLWRAVQARQRAATVALVRSLGGGWGESPPDPAAETTRPGPDAQGTAPGPAARVPGVARPAAAAATPSEPAQGPATAARTASN